MTFVDTNVLMYAVGREHPLRADAQDFLASALEQPRNALCTSAEVLQELLHAYVPVNRWETLDAALTLADACIPHVIAVEAQDVRAARILADAHPTLGARDLLHLAICHRHAVVSIKTYDRALAAAFTG